MVSARTKRIRQEVKKLTEEGYHDFASGVEKHFGRHPSKSSLIEKYIKQAFQDSYSVFEWCKSAKGKSQAAVYLREILSALPMSIALASLGVYDAAQMQLRYVLECQLSFMYFRHHPREFELANSDVDVWDQTRPKAVITYLKRLPENKDAIGQDTLASYYALYQTLCQFTHPRAARRLALRQYISASKPDSSQAELFSKHIKSYAVSSCAMFSLSFNAEYLKSSEVTQCVLMSTIPADRRRQIEQSIRNRI